MAFELFYAMLAGKHCRLQALRFVPSFSLDFFSDFCRQWRGWVPGALPAFNIISEIVKLRFLWSSDIRALWARLSGACNQRESSLKSLLMHENNPRWCLKYSIVSVIISFISMWSAFVLDTSSKSLTPERKQTPCTYLLHPTICFQSLCD